MESRDDVLRSGALVSVHQKCDTSDNEDSHLPAADKTNTKHIGVEIRINIKESLRHQPSAEIPSFILVAHNLPVHKKGWVGSRRF